MQTGDGSVFELSFGDDGSDEHVRIKLKLRPSESPAQPFTAGSKVVWHGSVHPEAFAPPSRMRSAACGPERLRSHWDEWPKPLANAATRLLMPQAPAGSQRSRGERRASPLPLAHVLQDRAIAHQVGDLPPDPPNSRHIPDDELRL